LPVPLATSHRHPVAVVDLEVEGVGEPAIAMARAPERDLPL